MVAQIFMLLDEDEDLLLNCHEMQQLAVKTGGELSVEEYEMCAPRIPCVTCFRFRSSPVCCT
jgi:hypothetical protein